jgi:hypothetical protein
MGAGTFEKKWFHFLLSRNGLDSRCHVASYDIEILNL